MKKNFFKFMALALTIISVGVLGSCKDYDEDRYADMSNYNELAIQKAVAELEKKLTTQKESIKDTVTIILNGYVKSEELGTKVSDILSDKGSSAHVIVTGIIDDYVAGKNFATKAQIDSLGQLIENMKCVCDYAAKFAAIESAINDNKAAIASNTSAIEAINSTLGVISSSIDGINGSIDGINGSIDGINGSIDGINGTLGNHTTDINKNKNDIADLYTKYNNLVATDAAINGRIDDLAADVNNNIESTKAAMAQALENKLAIEKVNSELIVMQHCIDSVADASTKALEDSITAVRAEAETNLKAAKDYADAVALNLSNLIDALTTRLNGVDSRIDGVDTRIDGIDVCINGMNTRIEDLDKLVNGILIDIKALQDKDSELDDNITELKNIVDELKDEIKNDINSLKDKDSELENLIKNLQAKDIQHDSFIQTLQAEDIKLWAAIEALQDQDKEFATNIKALQDKDKVLEDAIDANTENIATLQGEVAELKAAIEAIQNYLKSQITGIQVQASTNPVFGSFNTPFGINSTVLMGYYGNLEITPSAIKGTPFAGVESGEVMSETAGKLYLTINPITNDFSGVELELVNSKGQAAGIELSAVTPSDEELKFGYTRATVNANSETGLYEASASISNLEAAKMKYNRDALIEAARDLYNNKLSANFTNITKVLFDQANGILPAYAVQASWTDEAGKTHKVVSKYEIAATAIKPLGYNSLQEFSKNRVPQLERVRRFIDKWTGKANNMITFNLKNKITLPGKIDNVKVDTNGKTYKMHIKQTVNAPIDLKNVTIDKNSLKLEVKNENGNTRLYLKDDYAPIIWKYIDGDCHLVEGVNGLPEDNYVYVDLGDLKVDASQDIKFNFKDDNNTIDLDFWVDVTDFTQEVFDDIDSQLGGFNNSIDDLNKLISQAQDLMDDIEGKQNQYKSDINNLRDRLIYYIDKVNNRFGKFFDFHHMLQPCMIVETSKNASNLVGTEHAPQVIEAGKATVYLSSYTMDILAPAYKKALVVEDEAGLIQTSTLLENNEFTVNADFSVPGKYKLTYYAMDYYGSVEKVVRYIIVK